jgi:hypothetical protein
VDYDFERLIDAALAAYWQREPVTASFGGEAGFDDLLPRADAGAESDECRVIDELAGRLAALVVPDDPVARIEARHLAAYCTSARTAYARRARYRNPAWYTGESAFGLIALLLAPVDAAPGPALGARVRAIPTFLADGIARLRDVPIPAAWTARAQTELGALVRLLRQALPLHPTANTAGVTEADIAAVFDACTRFAGAIAQADAADAACGEAHLALIIGSVHGLSESPRALERRAAAAFEEVGAALERQARERDPARTWREQIAHLADLGPGNGDVVAGYREWHQRALRDAAQLVTPASDYELTFAPLPPWARPIAADLYFLFYRSPPARQAGSGSTYWVAPAHGTLGEIRRAHNTAAVKLVHAVHHGSIGHHTQNARARAAGSRFARMAGTDGASAVALLASGTLAEGWACYAEDLMAEIPDFYTRGEELQLAYFELRNIASMLADIRFHTGAYTLDEMRRFYRDDVAFAPARVDSETTRNAMFPGSRLMYWSGSQQIKALRRACGLPAKAFHDKLLSFGAAPVAWLAEEFAR